jgi:hypothetical protein
MDRDFERPVSARLLDIRSDGIIKFAPKTQASLVFTTRWTSEVGGTSPFFSGMPRQTRASTSHVNYIESSSGRTEPGESKVADHGLIGDLRTAALVSTKGTIDWLCVPRFDAPSVFCALLDSERGGAWRLAPTCEVSTTQQFYFPDSNVLITRFLTEDGVAEVRDFMPVDSGDDLLVRRYLREQPNRRQG